MKIRSGMVALGLAAMLSAGCTDSPTSSQPVGSNLPGETNDDIVTVQPAPGSSPVFGRETHGALLVGSAVQPAVVTTANGVASFMRSSDGDSIAYAVTVSFLEGATGAQIRTSSGELVAELYRGLIPGEHNGQLTQGVISASSLRGSLAGASITHLADLMSTGGAYVEVQSVSHPNGVIRGIVRAVPDESQ